MITRMISVLSAVAVLAWAGVCIANPPIHKLSGYSLNVSNGWSTVGTMNLSHYFPESSAISVQLSASNNAASTANTIVTLYPTDDGVTTNNNGTLSMTLVNTGTIQSSIKSNFTVGGDSGWFIAVTNTASGTVSNFVSLTISQKSGL